MNEGDGTVSGVQTAALCWALTLAFPLVAYQAPPQSEARPQRVLGEVTAKTADSVTVKPDAGEIVTLTVDPSAKIQKVAPGETDLSKAQVISLEDISVGDRVRVRVNGTTAASVIVISRQDLAKKHEADRAEWQRRGTAGTVSSVDAGAGRIQLQTRSSEGPKTVVVEITPNTQFRRYAQDSVKFADAKSSSIGEIAKGDQVRVLGDREGESVKAEVVVFGTFRNIAGTVLSVDPNKNQIRIRNLDGNKPFVVEVQPDTTMKQLPERMAMFLARTREGGGPQGGMNRGDARPPDGAGPRGPMGGGAGGGPGGMRGPGMGGPGGPGRGDFSQMLERFPSFTLADLKPGDALVIASTAGSPDKATAITILSGVEPLLAAAPPGTTDRGPGGTWNFDINIIP